MQKAEPKTDKENYDEFVAELEAMDGDDVRHFSRMRTALHDWAVRAIDDVMKKRRLNVPD